MIQNELLSMSSIVNRQANTPFDTNKKLLKRSMGMFAAHLGTWHIKHDEVSLGMKRKLIAHLGNGKAASHVNDMRQFV